MPYKSKLYKRNAGGSGKKSALLYSPRRTQGFYPPNPQPPRSALGINRREQKYRTVFPVGSEECLENPDVIHLDIINQGTGANERLGQKFKVTGVHIRGFFNIQGARAKNHDFPGYYLVWDKQPNELLPISGQILALSGGTNADFTFPLAGNEDRFIILARKQAQVNKSDNQVDTTGLLNNSTVLIDDYYQFKRNLQATTLLGGNGNIDVRTTGALYLVPFGRYPTGVASTMDYNYRVYFEDV